MLSIFFKAPYTLRRLRSGSAGRFTDDYARRLHEAGYSSGTARERLRTAAHLTKWLDGRGLPLRDWDEAALQRFWEHLDTCGCGRVNDGSFPFAVAGTRGFLAYLREVGVVRACCAKRPPHFSLVDDFGSWLRQHRGATTATLKVYTPVVADYIVAIGGRCDRITATTLRRFVLRRVVRRGRNRGRCAATALRTFVRFLVCIGKVQPGIETAIPALRKWRLASLPAYLSADETARVIAACDPATTMGARDRAVILLLARLGLRAGDVADLRLRSVDFSTASIRVSGKARREVRLPLPQDVGDALMHYLTAVRPKVKDGRVFIRSQAPLGPLTSRAVTSIAQAAILRAGVKTARLGAHVLRYSAATDMLRQGASLDEVGAILRHRSRDMTAHYAKIDVDLLRLVAQPWPEVRPC